MSITISSVCRRCFPLVVSFDTSGQCLMYSSTTSIGIHHFFYYLLLLLVVVVFIIASFFLLPFIHLFHQGYNHIFFHSYQLYCTVGENSASEFDMVYYFPLIILGETIRSELSLLADLFLLQVPHCRLFL